VRFQRLKADLGRNISCLAGVASQSKEPLPKGWAKVSLQVVRAALQLQLFGAVPAELAMLFDGVSAQILNRKLRGGK
jgi:hypothetical protein